MAAMDTVPPDRDLAAIGLLQDPVRRALYGHVVADGGEVSRNQAAEAVGVQRGLAAFHLDKLVEAGLLEASFRRLGERRGPGAGPAGQALPAGGRRGRGQPAPADLRDRRPPAGRDGRADRGRPGAPGGGQARRPGGRAGGWLTEATGPGPAIGPVLGARGYEPYRDGATLRLRNCPFANLAGEFPVLVCAMNLALVEGLLEGLGDQAGRAVMDPAPGRCCVAVHDRPQDSKANQD